MSTAVDTAFEEIVASDNEAPEPGHAVCAICFPPYLFGVVEVVAICGHVYPEGSPWLPEGGPKCARCLALSTTLRFPCGH